MIIGTVTGDYPINRQIKTYDMMMMMMMTMTVAAVTGSILPFKLALLHLKLFVIFPALSRVYDLNTTKSRVELSDIHRHVYSMCRYCRHVILTINYKV